MRLSSPQDGGGIFISYRRKDVPAYAGRLYDRLIARFGKDRVFMDIGSINVGADFTREIITRVSGCDVLLALIGRSWTAITDDKGRRRIDNPYDLVRIEIETALKRGIWVVPVLVDGAVLPQESDLPPSLRPLLERHAFQLSHTSFEFEISHLIEALRGSVTGQKREWNLELVADKSTATKRTFRLSSGKQAHDISVSTEDGITISVDGKVVAKEPSWRMKKKYPLRNLNSMLGSDVYITVQTGFWGGVNRIVLTIGDQNLIYSGLWQRD